MSILKVNQIQKNTDAAITLGSDVTTDNDITLTTNANLAAGSAAGCSLPAGTIIGSGNTFSATGLTSTGTLNANEVSVDSRTVSSALPRVGGVLQFTATWLQNAAAVGVSNLSVISGTGFGIDTVAVIANEAADASSGIQVNFTSGVTGAGDNAKGIVMVRLNPGSTNPHQDDFFFRTVITDGNLKLYPTHNTDHGHSGTNKVVQAHLLVISPN